MTWSSNIPGDAHLGGRHPIQVVVVLDVDVDGVVLQQVCQALLRLSR